MGVGLTSAVIFAAAWIGIATVIVLSPKQIIPPGALLLLVLLVPLVLYLWIVGNPFLCVMFLGAWDRFCAGPSFMWGGSFAQSGGVRPFEGPKFDFYK